MPGISDLVMMSTTTTGTGSITLASVPGYNDFNTVFPTSATLNVFNYFIIDDVNGGWEVGYGHMSSSTVLARDTVVSSSNANALVSFAAGTKRVTNDLPAFLNPRYPIDNTINASTALGVSALLNQTSTAAYGNTAIGYQAMGTGTITTAAISNVAIGYQAAKSITSGTANTVLGYQAAGTSITSGGANTLLGYKTGTLISTGSNNTIIGNAVGSTVLTTGSGNILIGTSSAVTTTAAGTSNYLNIGGALQSDMSTGAKFVLPITNGNNLDVLQSDGAGNTSWVARAGVVNSGTANQIAYYASTGSALSGNTATIDASGNIATPGTITITSSSASALSVGQNGSTTPAFSVDASTASSITGLQIQSKALAGGVTMVATSTALSEGAVFAAKGGGTVALNTIGGVGNIGLQINSTNAYRINGAQGFQHVFMSAANSTAANIRFGYSGSADTALTASTEAPSTYFNLGQIRQHATGSLTLQRDFRITGSTHSFAGSSTLTDAAAFSVDGPGSAGTNATITNSHGILVPASTISGTVINGSAITAYAPNGATNNFAARFFGNTSITGSHIFSGATSGTVTVKAPAVAGTTNFQLPDSNGTSGQYLQTDGSGNASWQSVSGSSPDSEWFGDGSDGNVTISSGVTTMTRDMYYNNLTINGTGQLQTNLFRVFVSGVLDLSAAPAGAIIAPTPGNGGNGAASGTLGAAGAATSSADKTVLGGRAGIAGNAGGTGAPGAITASNGGQCLGGYGGGGGNGEKSGNGSGGTGGTNPTITPVPPGFDPRYPTSSIFWGFTTTNFSAMGGNGGLGGAGDGTAAGGGGGGGAGGNGIAIFANTLNRSGSTAAGAIVSTAGNGGLGGTPSAGNRGGGMGGCGGGGPYMSVVYKILTGTAATNIIQSKGGNGGNGGSGFGTGTGGYGGAAGKAGVIVAIQIGGSTISASGTRTASPVALAGGANSGITNGTGTTGETISVTI